jgi:large subunit ribosomal protein L24
MSNMHVRKGDNVIVLVGKSEKEGGDKGKIGRIIAAVPKAGKVVVENINMQKHHKKARSAQDTGGILSQAGPIDSSNVMIVCPRCSKPTRVAHKTDESGKKARVCKKCGESLDKSVNVKAEKKEKAKEKKKEAQAKKTTPSEVTK